MLWSKCLKIRDYHQSIDQVRRWIKIGQMEFYLYLMTSICELLVVLPPMFSHEWRLIGQERPREKQSIPAGRWDDVRCMELIIRYWAGQLASEQYELKVHPVIKKIY